MFNIVWSLAPSWAEIQAAECAGSKGEHGPAGEHGKQRLVEKVQRWINSEVSFSVCNISESVSKLNIQMRGEGCLRALCLITRS